MYTEIDILSDEFTTQLNTDDRAIACRLLNLKFYIEDAQHTEDIPFHRMYQEIVVTAGEGNKTDVVFAGPVYYTPPLSIVGDMLLTWLEDCLDIYNGMGLDHIDVDEWVINFHADWDSYDAEAQQEILVMYRQAYTVLSPLFDALNEDDFELLQVTVER